MVVTSAKARAWLGWATLSVILLGMDLEESPGIQWAHWAIGAMLVWPSWRPVHTPAWYNPRGLQGRWLAPGRSFSLVGRV
jgi:hypothetical protein